MVFWTKCHSVPGCCCISPIKLLSNSGS
jgi:hypothetical protein